MCVACGMMGWRVACLGVAGSCLCYCRSMKCTSKLMRAPFGAPLSCFPTPLTSLTSPMFPHSTSSSTSSSLGRRCTRWMASSPPAASLIAPESTRRCSRARAHPSSHPHHQCHRQQRRQRQHQRRVRDTRRTMPMPMALQARRHQRCSADTQPRCRPLVCACAVGGFVVFVVFVSVCVCCVCCWFLFCFFFVCLLLALLIALYWLVHFGCLAHVWNRRV